MSMISFHFRVFFQLLKTEMSPVALWELCLSGKLVKVRAALASGEDVNRKDMDNRTGLMWAVIRNHIQL